MNEKDAAIILNLVLPGWEKRTRQEVTLAAKILVPRQRLQALRALQAIEKWPDLSPAKSSER